MKFYKVAYIFKTTRCKYNISQSTFTKLEKQCKIGMRFSCILSSRYCSGDFLAISFGQLAFAIYKFFFTMGYSIFSSGYGHKNPERPLIMVLSQGIFFQGVNLQLPLSWCGRLNIFFSGFSYYFFLRDQIG